jgi:hypothetical protein
MKDKLLSTTLCNLSDKSLSGWDQAILDAKQRIAGLNRAIQTFKDSRDSGMEFPEPKTGKSKARRASVTSGSNQRLMGQK